MWALELLAEQRIQDAIDAGEFDRLPGAGKKLVLDDTALVPPSLRGALRILRKNKIMPPVLALRTRISRLEADAVEERGAARAQALEELALLRFALEAETTRDRASVVAARAAGR